MQLYHDSNHSYIKNNDLHKNTGDGLYRLNHQRRVKFFVGIQRKKTNVSGVTVTGNIVGTSFTASGGTTGQTAFVNQHAVGVGSTTTTGKFTGVGTDNGTIVFDVTKVLLNF